MTWCKYSSLFYYCNKFNTSGFELLINSLNPSHRNVLRVKGKHVDKLIYGRVLIDHALYDGRMKRHHNFFRFFRLHLFGENRGKLNTFQRKDIVGHDKVGDVFPVPLADSAPSSVS